MHRVGKAVTISRSGQGALSRAIAKRLKADGMDVRFETQAPVEDPDVSICTSGKMIISRPWEALEHLPEMFQANYAEPRRFIEQEIAKMQKFETNGQIIVIGSNSARYGKPFAEDYSALKTALWKFCELRAIIAKEYGIRITCINLGGVYNEFWNHVRSQTDFHGGAAVAYQMIPEAGKGMTSEEVAEFILMLINMPKNLAMKDCLLVGRAYQ